MADPQDAEVPAAALVMAPFVAGNQAHVKLAAFLPQNPVLWFAQAECQFQVKGVAGQFDRYCHVVSALPHESLLLVADLVEAPATEIIYDDIKQRLVASHQLSDFQKAEKLFLRQSLGGRKPSEMMAAMLEVCPRGEEKTNLFACFFLQRLLREIKVLLARVNHKNPKALAQQADELWALHDGHSKTVAAVQPDFGDGEMVAALRTGDRGRGGAAHGAGPGVLLAAPVAAEAVAALRLRSLRRQGRRGWRLGSASSIGAIARPPLPVPSPAHGRETARPGATKCLSPANSFI
jgi:hypothetical protein